MSEQTKSRFVLGRAIGTGQRAILAGDSVVALLPDETIGCTFSAEAADLIVRACNAHDELVAALDQAVTSMQDSGYSNRHLAVRAARAAIAKAGAA